MSKIVSIANLPLSEYAIQERKRTARNEKRYSRFGFEVRMGVLAVSRMKDSAKVRALLTKIVMDSFVKNEMENMYPGDDEDDDEGDDQ